MTITALLSAVWVFSCSVYNYREPRLPNLLILVGLIGSLIFRAQHWTTQGIALFEVFIVVATWSLAVTFWKLRWWGAGDAKFLMTLTLAFPDIAMIIWMMSVNMIAGIYGMYRLNSAKPFVWRNTIFQVERLENSAHRLRAVTLLGIGWFIWFAMEVT